MARENCVHMAGSVTRVTVTSTRVCYMDNAGRSPVFNSTRNH
jgi:hypothetical protein